MIQPGRTHDLQRCLEQLAEGDNWPVECAQLLLQHGHEARASDLHIDITATSVRVQYKVGGHIHESALVVGGERGQRLLAWFKVLAGVPAFVIHEPQDGRILFKDTASPAAAAGWHLRVAFLPIVGGALVTVRYPVQDAALPSFAELGMPPAVADAVLRVLAVREGTLAITGPAGSGKTTTLHALLHHLHDLHGPRLHMLSVEDPVERTLPFVSQVQVHEPTGLTYPVAARAALRHAPGVLLIGEVRDPETAAVALQAGLSGHLVLTTLHAGRAARVPGRLLALGVAPWMVAASLAGTVAQRLAYPGSDAPPVPLFEAMTMTEDLRRLIANGDTGAAYQAAMAQAQVTSLADHAAALMAAGRLEEAEVRFALGDALREDSAPAGSGAMVIGR